MIIDAHAHACGKYLISKDIIETLDINNVDKVVLVPGEFGSDKNYSLPELANMFPNTDVVSFTNYMTKIVIKLSGMAKKIDEGNRYVFSLANDYPDRIIQFYWIKLSESDALGKLNSYFIEYKFKGIKLHQCWESFKVDSEIFNQVAEWASSKDLPIFVHLFSKNQATRLSNYIKTHPKTIFIVAHLFGLERYIRTDISSDNIFFEISTPQLISIERLIKAIKYFGANRIILGSDVPYGKNNLRTNIDRVKNLNISNEEKDMILGGNIRRILKI